MAAGRERLDRREADRAGDVNHDGYGDLVAVEADGSLTGYGNGTLVNPGGLPYRSPTWHIVGDWRTVRLIA